MTDALNCGFTAVYMQFFNYFLVEKLFGGNRHFGLSDEQVIQKLSEIYCRGLLRSDKAIEGAAGRKSKTSRENSKPSRLVKAKPASKR